MSPTISRNTLGGYENFPPNVALAVQQALLSFPQEQWTLSCNPSLHPTVWQQLWEGNKQVRLTAEAASNLVKRPLDKILRARVIAKEKRSTVLVEFIAYNVLDLDEQILLGKNLSIIPALLETSWLDKSLRHPLAVLAGGETLLQEMALSPVSVFCDLEVISHINQSSSWPTAIRDRGRYLRNLRIIFGLRPHIIKDCITVATPAVLTSIAGSANLTSNAAVIISKFSAGVCALRGEDFIALDYCLLALANNPRTPIKVLNALDEIPNIDPRIKESLTRRKTKPVVSGPISKFTDKEILKWLLSRACVSKTHTVSPLQGRPVELIELYKNKNLDNEQREQIVNTFIQWVEPRLWPKSLVTDSPKVAPLKATTPIFKYPTDLLLDLAVNVLGDNKEKWDVLIGLIPGFSGTFEDLVRVSDIL
jgi:hypothetical protein